MKRKCFLLTAFAIGVLLVFMQLCALQYLLKWVEEQKDEESENFLNLVKRVTEDAQFHGVPLFLSDPVILSRILDLNEHDNPNCQVLCPLPDILHLSTLAHLSSRSQRDALAKALLSRRDLKITQSKGTDRSLLRHGLEVTIPYHYFVTNTAGHIVHISVFTERVSAVWWNSPIEDSVLKALGLNCHFSRESIFPKVEIHRAVIDGVKIFVPYPVNNLNFIDRMPFKECNYTQTAKFYERQGKDITKDAEEFQANAWKLLAKATRLLDRLNVPFWLSSGTCLGYFRQCSIIPYSQDVDIGIFIKDFKPDIISTFSTHNLPLTHSFGKVSDSFELSFREGDIKLDIFFFYEEEDYFWNGGTQARTGKKFKYIFPKFKLCWTEFLELLVRVPCETEAYIKANYGNNWFEPVKVWDWKRSPPNVVENGIWPIDQWPEVIQLIPLPEQK